MPDDEDAEELPLLGPAGSDAVSEQPKAARRMAQVAIRGMAWGFTTAKL